MAAPRRTLGSSRDNQNAWITSMAGQSAPISHTNWPIFGSFDWNSENSYIDAGLPGIASFPSVGVISEQQNRDTREIVTGLDISGTTESVQQEPMAPPPLHSLTGPLVSQPAPNNFALPQKGRRRQPPDSTWNKYKHKIKDLYMTQDLSLEDTMKQMEKEDGFFPSKKMYKEKFKIWQWSKKLPQSKAKWMLGRANERNNPNSNPPKDTVFNWGNQVWTVERVKQTVKRNNVAEDTIPQDGPTPSDIVVKTPICIVDSPQNAASPGRTRPSDRPWTPTALESTSRGSKVSSLRFRWNNLTLSDIQNLKSEAARLDKAGDIANAEIKFRNALLGFEELLSSTHEETAVAAYQLASFFANHDRMREADRVLDWLGGKYIQRWGLNHAKTVSHLLRLIELLQSWARHDDAMLLLGRVLDCWDDMDSDLGPEFVTLRAKASQDPEFDGIDPDIVDQIFEDSSDEHQIDSQLRVVSLWLSSTADGLEPILVRLIQQCEKYPDKLRVQTLQARCSLARLYLRLDQRHSAINALEMAQKSLFEILAISENLHGSILKTARQMAFALVECDDVKSSNDILEQVADRLESRLGDDKNQIGVAVGFLSDIGREYQSRSTWQNAAPWFERALAISMIGLGSDDGTTKKLEAALENRQFYASSKSYEEFEELLRSGSRQFSVRLTE